VGKTEGEKALLASSGIETVNEKMGHKPLF